MRSSSSLAVALIAGCAVGCGDLPTESDVAVGVTDPDDGVAMGNTWRFEGRARIEQVEVRPVPVGVEGAFTVGLHVVNAKGCTADIFAWPPRRAAEQHVWRGRETPLAHDTRGTNAQIAIDGDDVQTEVTLRLERPWHPSAVTVELELSCGGRRRAVVQGPRRELRSGGDRQRGGRAVLGVFEVDRVPTPIDVVHTSTPPTIDGTLAPGEWGGTTYSLVTSIEGEPIFERGTEVWFAWDASAMYVAARATDPDAWSEFTEHDDPLWEQEVFEVFVGGTDMHARAPYLEYQVSPAGVAFDARFAKYRDGDPKWNGQWERAAKVEGTMNDPRSIDRGWTVEMKLPWSELRGNVDITGPLREGTTFRLNAFRFERFGRKRTVGSALSPTMTTDFHAWDNAAVARLAGP